MADTKFSEQINPFTMRFKNQRFENEYNKYKFEEKNFLVLLGMIVYFNIFILGLRSVQAFFNNYLDLKNNKVGNFITIPYMILCNLPLIEETCIYFIKKLRILRGFGINLFPFIGIIIYSTEYCNNIYFTGTPMFISATIIFIPIAFISALVYAANWICGTLQLLCQTIIIISGIIAMPGNPYLDKPWFILMVISTFFASSLTLYYFEYFQRKSNYLKVIAELQKECIEKVIQIIPEPFIIAKDGQVYYHNSAYDKIQFINENIDNLNDNNCNTERRIDSIWRLNAIPDFDLTLKKITKIENGESLLNVVSSKQQIISDQFQIVNLNQKVKHFEVTSFKITFPLHESMIYFLKDLTSFDKMKELESKERYQRLYVASITHDFRTPIGIILGNSEMLDDCIKEEEPKGYIKNINQAAKILSLLVQDLLDYAQLKSDKLKISPSYFNLKEEVEGLVQLFIEKYRDKGLYLELGFYNMQTNPIYNDANRLKQVLMNLLSNAFKFTRNGGVTIRVEELIESNTISFAVIDSGIGISEKDLNKLFTEYCRIESHKEINPNGIGLGLHICQKLVQRLGGNLAVKSTINIGSTFSFFIQTKLVINQNLESIGLNTNQANELNKYNIPTGFQREIEEEKHIENQSPFGLLNFNWIVNQKLIKHCLCASILIVDDDPSIRNVLKNYSKKCLVSCDEAENGIKAVEFVIKKISNSCCKWYSLILMDNEMPYMNGIEASKIIKDELKQIPDNETKIVLVSGFDDNDIIYKGEDVRELFFKTYTKPISFPKFRELLSNV